MPALNRRLPAVFFLLIGAMHVSNGYAENAPQPGTPYATLPVFDALSEAEWRRVDKSVARGLEWLAKHVGANGGFDTHSAGQPAVTSLVTMAFLSRGHRPGAGPYGKMLDLMIDYTLSKQNPDGLFCMDAVTEPQVIWGHSSHTATYNHAIAGLMLSEAYGLTDSAREKKIREAIIKGLAYARKMQRRPSPYPLDKGGVRYPLHLHAPFPTKGEADLSVTGWYVMFYRSARNAEFDVPEDYVREALEFVLNCYDKKSGGFVYGPYPDDYKVGRGMTGAGLLCLSMAGERKSAIARSAGEWIVRHPFTQYHDSVGGSDRFHYGAYYCSQAMFMLGGDYWRDFYPPLAQTLLDNQRPDGSWVADRADARFAEPYATALSILSLTPPYQLLPIYQR